MPAGNFGDKATGLFGWANNNPSSKNAIYDTEFINSAAGSRAASPPWMQPRGKLFVSLVNSHTNATRIGWHLRETDLRFAPELPPGWLGSTVKLFPR